jgi:cell pole-organizing protein PopZ
MALVLASRNGLEEISGMNASNPQHEPTMEEILASIRKIISEDQSEQVRPAASGPKLVPPFEPEILELTDEVADEEPVPLTIKAAIPPARDFHNDVAFQNIEEPPETQKASEPVTNSDELISDSTRGAIGRVFEAIDEPAPQRAPHVAGGSLESVFERAIQEAFEPALQKWINGNTDEIMQRMRPLILEWMDENLPALIEGSVQKEIARAVKARRR